MTDETRRYGPAPRRPGYVRRVYAPQLHPTVIEAIAQEADKRDTSLARVVGEILEQWYSAKLMTDLDDVKG